MITLPALYFSTTKSVSPTPELQTNGIPIAIISPCFVGDDAFLENVGRIKKMDVSKIEMFNGTSLCRQDVMTMSSFEMFFSKAKSKIVEGFSPVTNRNFAFGFSVFNILK